jgi:hypothetical protein
MEKERIIRLDAYSMAIAFTLRETPESELYCYAYAAAVSKAIDEKPTLGGVADRAIVTGKKYMPPKKAYGGNEWVVTIDLRITIEQMRSEELEMKRLIRASKKDMRSLKDVC